jgi:hypothetical protein
LAYNWTRENLDVYDDQITINKTLSILRTDYFTSKLDDLEDFAGFCPRWLIPQTRMVADEDHNKTRVATQTMLIIDSAKETKVGVGLNSWPPTLLKEREVMIP